ncbi:MAG: DNA-3-methyladenine glycosylase 2 family protein [Candidatus Kaiserbacteria bacterium]|nr:DNA-3-methyladenine glycosylase 2 family protein [Candidatus Kaiserbacteria bacterium]
MTQPDFSTSVRALRKDPKMAALIKKHGLPDLTRYHGKISVFESLLRSIVYQQLSGYAAAAIHGRVLALFRGGKPSPQALLKIRAPRLRKAGLSIQKITYVRDLAKKCIDGTVDEKRFPKMTSEEIVEHLVAVKGIGAWTAHMMLIFRLHRTDILPVGDLAIRKGFQKVYGLKHMPSSKEMEKIASPWRDHASIASWYLWREMDGAKSKV